MFCRSFLRFSSIRGAVTVAAALMITSAMANQSQAQGAGPSPFGFGFQPFGFYQPFGATFGNSIRTPPHFSLNPPVYYGARHSRPYGVSPFAAPPVTPQAPNFQSRLRTQFVEPQFSTPGPASRLLHAPCNGCSAYTHQSGVSVAAAPLGKMQFNPFATDETTQLAKN